jgi:hypothetical protein
MDNEVDKLIRDVDNFLRKLRRINGNIYASPGYMKRRIEFSVRVEKCLDKMFASCETDNKLQKYEGIINDN